MLPVRTMLFATDFSECSAAAFELACALARDYRAKLVIVHVVPPPMPMVADGYMYPMPSLDLNAVREQLRKTRPCDPAITVEFVVTEGDAAYGILQLAEDTKADLIVMGTHGRTGLRRLLMGSVAEKVVRRATCPVVSVKSAATLTPSDSAEAKGASETVEPYLLP